LQINRDDKCIDNDLSRSSLYMRSVNSKVFPIKYIYLLMRLEISYPAHIVPRFHDEALLCKEIPRITAAVESQLQVGYSHGKFVVEVELEVNL
jgi:hypothetical protein